MELESLRSALLWCFIINYGVLLLWVIMIMFAREWIYRLHGRWFRLSTEKFDFAQYLSMAIFKLAIILFNLVPWIALHIVG